MNSNFGGTWLGMAMGLTSRARWARLLASALGVLVPLGLALAAALAGRPGMALAGGVVSGACTEADLDTALAGGGVVTFNCGGPVTITLTTEKLITSTTTINGPTGGANRVTFDGAGTVRLFHVQSPATLVLLNDLALVNGSAPGQGGAVLVDTGAVLNAQNVRFEHNRASNFGGAIGNYGRALIYGSTVYSNSAPTNGGAIDSTGLLELAGNTFDQNYAGFRGGGVNNFLGNVRQWSGAPTMPSAFTGNRSGGYGGALVNDQGTITLTAVFTDNHSSGAGGAFKNSGQAMITGTFALNSSTGADGGAIWNNLSLEVGASAFTGNSASQGGAIYSDAVVTVTTSTFSGNSAPSKGGAIFVATPARLAVRASTFAGNTSLQGQTIYALGRTAIDGSTFHHNGQPSSGNAGAIETWTRLDVLNSTFSQNQAYHAGAILMQNGLVLITNTTFVGNTAGAGLPNGGQIMVSSPVLTPSLRLLNSVLSGGVPNNCSDPLTSLGGNVEDANACGLHQPSDHPNTNPRLGPLQNNGGAARAVTLTHMPLPGSPAIDGALLANCPPLDERGIHRPLGPGCDSGAVEAGLPLWLPLIRR